MKREDPGLRQVHFGDFEADFRAGELRSKGVKIKLQKQPFEVLEMLLERPHEVISRDELRQRIWPIDTFVDFDQGLSNAIKRLREALCDSAENPRFIETVPRRGYRFLGATTQSRQDSIGSIAVLPFVNTSVDPDAGCLALGIPGSIIHNLSQIPELRVIAWNAASGLKSRDSSLQTSAPQLNARAVLLGRIWQRGNRLHLSGGPGRFHHGRRTVGRTIRPRHDRSILGPR
jgi:DNA-binding winged helix-turn-helix (wHTH) protein